MDPNTFVPPPPPLPVQQPLQQEQPPATAEDMVAFINNLQARQKHLEDQLQLSNQWLQQQSNWVPPPPPGPPSQPPTPPRGPPPPPPPHSPLRLPLVTLKRPKFAVPPKFTGKMVDALPFLHSCQLYIKGRPKEFSDDRTTIYWICSFMPEGAAVEWRDNLIEAGEAGEQAPKTLEEFWVVFKGRLQRPQPSKHENNETQNNGAGNKDHGQTRPGLQEGVALVEEFKRSIHKAIREKLCNAETPPVTITEWYTRATASDRQWRRTKAEEQLYAPHGASPKKPATTTTTTAPAATQQNQYNSWRPQGGNPMPAPQAPPAPLAPRDLNAMDVD
ncbi:hypothetical protein DXG01_005670 [Tephrocybe rancida]|nr:hypothetical protein DXG01_005670 [Tephrocybe rancida]